MLKQFYNLDWNQNKKTGFRQDRMLTFAPLLQTLLFFNIGF